VTEKIVTSLVTIQYLSLNASVEPNAQQDPQADWSLTRETLGHAGQASRASKESGTDSASKTGLTILGFGPFKMVPIRAFACPIVIPSNLSL